MSHRLRVAPVRSSSRLSGALSAGEAAEYGTFDGEVLVVEEFDDAADLVERRHNVSWAEGEPAPPTPDTDTADSSNSNVHSAFGTCDVVMSSGDVCGRDRPCQYHD